MKMSDKIAMLRKARPLISIEYAKYLHAKPADLNKRGARIVVYLVLWSDDGRVSLHKTEFGKERPMHVAEWAGWLQVHSPRIFVDNVLPFVNRAFGSAWNIDRVFGWHFVIGSKRKARK